ncbi:related to Ras GTPase-activating-like protein IQGAP1 [Cephalotrichum gorgonifer]|uniref:Related to Ras GTPase-activating-like protein IQGAP1 n=1 Tax=Cephalotrichum gorgonifer TaxID=2041049 RepID=A0AAE8N9F0_9PEZI|nr:related to Ras GTPase-activating-like protein IQGAP1 [Cephalotrichum gorgonifer]
MAFRPPTLRQSLTADYPTSNVNRQPSTTSSASSGYSYASDSTSSSRFSALSSTCNSPRPQHQHQYQPSTPAPTLHKRGQSDVGSLAHTFEAMAESHSPKKGTQENIYSSVRHSLRPLPQSPVQQSGGVAPSPPRHLIHRERGYSVDVQRSAAPSPPRFAPHQRERGQSVDIEAHTASSPTRRPQYHHERGQTVDMGRHIAPSPPRHLTHQHERGKSMDHGRLSITHDEGSRTLASPPRPLALRPNSMLLTRSDSISRGSPTSPMSPGSSHLVPTTTHLAKPDLERLGRSTTSQLRTLSTLAQSESAEDFAITSPAQEVVGLRGRRRLQRSAQNGGQAVAGGGGYGWEGRNWMDKQRQFLAAYEYLCHIGEAKEWIEDITHKSIPPIVELEEALRDGVTLAEVVEALNPDKRYRIFHHPRLQYRHSDNIAIFFRYLDEVELPDLFRFELIDLYEKKNIPKVIYCIHALSWLLFRKGIVDFRIGNLVGQLEFEHHELEAMQKGLDKLGINMPSFGNMGADFGVEPEPEPEETEEERVDRELGECEGMIVDLQSQIRGAMTRMRLGAKMERLWNSEERLIDLQSRIRGDFARQIFGYRLDMRRFAANLQSAARGFLVRRRQANSERFWKMIEPDILELQSLFRAKRVRDQVCGVRSQLERHAGPLREIQAISRGLLVRRARASQQKETARAADGVERLQAAIRGMQLRWALAEDQRLLKGQAEAITALQTFARAALTRGQIASEHEELESFNSEWVALQSLARGSLVRAETKALKAELKSHSPQVTLIQSFVRAAAVRRDVAEKHEALHENEEAIIQLQAHIRGMAVRREQIDDQESLIRQEPKIRLLQARMRGYLYRQRHANFLDDLRSHTPEITTLQSLARAMLVRAEVGELLFQLEEAEESIIELQAIAQGHLVRARFQEKRRFFRENMQKVIKIQSFVRAKIQGEAYKSLTTGKDPPVGAVKNFVHLLNDSDFDFNEEVEFERMRKTVVQQVRQNETLEQYIDQLDIKIALLVKNKITLDEVVSHQHALGGHALSMIANSSMASANQFDLKALNKSSRRKLESYQQLFFTLQTQPQYLARLFRRIREQGTAEKECRRVELLVMSLFGWAQKRREEYYLLKLVARSIREEVEGSRTMQDYARGSYFWSKIVANYTRSPRDRKYLRDLLGPLIRDNIIEDPALDLESDPMQIYRSAINNEELRTGRPSHRPLDVPREVAIKDPETRDLFIDHLRDLREICDQFLVAFEDLLPRFPYGLRFLCRTMFESLCQHFPDEPQHLVLFTVTNWLWRFYLQPALTGPEAMGVIERQLSPLQKRNLGEVAKVIGQAASGRLFGGENVYLQPLNAFVSDTVERLGHIMGELISVADAESTFDIDEFNDLYAKNKPTLYIKMADIFAIHKLVASELAYVCPPGGGRDDVVREIMQELGSAKSNESEMSASASSADIQMSLTPKLHDVEDPEAEVKALFMETKRCVLYIIRVQQGPNLLDILIKPITPEDEVRWRALLREDFSGSGSRTKGAYSDANMVDVSRMTYHELKRTALENVLRLEQMGRISKRNRYQDILNAIASDIRSKSRRRVQRQRELEGVRLTLGNLHEKAKYLEQQRKSYDDYIESAMATLQKNKGKKRFLLPFTKQYNHQRELERSGRVPKFGSYKYSVRSLSERGCVVSWKGVSERDWDKINLTISCDEVGVFTVEGSKGSIQIPGASAVISIEDLLAAQFEARQFVELFEGGLRMNVNLILHLLYKKFYRTQ